MELFLFLPLSSILKVYHPFQYESVKSQSINLPILSHHSLLSLWTTYTSPSKFYIFLFYINGFKNIICVKGIVQFHCNLWCLFMEILSYFYQVLTLKKSLLPDFSKFIYLLSWIKHHPYILFDF